MLTPWPQAGDYLPPNLLETATPADRQLSSLPPRLVDYRPPTLLNQAVRTEAGQPAEVSYAPPRLHDYLPPLLGASLAVTQGNHHHQYEQHFIPDPTNSYTAARQPGIQANNQWASGLDQATKGYQESTVSRPFLGYLEDVSARRPDQVVEHRYLPQQAADPPAGGQEAFRSTTRAPYVLSRHHQGRTMGQDQLDLTNNGHSHLYPSQSETGFRTLFHEDVSQQQNDRRRSEAADQWQPDRRGSEAEDQRSHDRRAEGAVAVKRLQRSIAQSSVRTVPSVGASRFVLEECVVAKSNTLRENTELSTEIP